MSNYSTAPAETLALLALLEPADPINTEFSWRYIEPASNQGFIPTSPRPRNLRGTFGEVKTQLDAANLSSRAAIYLMIQGNDGLGFGKNNVNDIRALFLDLDEDGPAKLEAVMQGPHTPNLVIESSPNKYHCYWQVTDLPVAEYEGRTKQLIEKYGGDPSCHDLARILRVPGFYHHKTEPFRSRIAYRASEVVPLTPDNLVGWLGQAPRAQRISKRREARLGTDAPPVARENNLIDLIGVVGIHDRVLAPGKHSIICPWYKSHTNKDTTGTVYWEPSTQNAWQGGYKCQHAHCQERNITMLRQFLWQRAAWLLNIDLNTLWHRRERGEL